jgi:hypothetical protein
MVSFKNNLIRGGTVRRGRENGEVAYLAKCFFFVPASLAVQGDIMLSVGETMEAFL